MSQMCPNCSYNNDDDAKTCTNCSVSLRGLLGENSVLAERYKVISVLGCGAMGAVYLAEDVRLVGRRCAIKQNRSDPNTSVEIRTQSREQFLAEANILARLDHPGLPKVSDYFVEHDNEFLVMDYVEGEDLDSLIHRSGQPLTEDQVLPWVDQVLDALAYLHNQPGHPIIHRDIKPANIRLNLVQNRVKLVDFGLVKLLDSENPETKVELRGIGTPAYAPLEQFASSERHTDARSDIYALGATIYHLLTNLYPPDVHQRVLNPETLTPPRQLNTQLSENMERVILRAMEVHPDQRFQSAEKMREALLSNNQRTSPLPVSKKSATPPSSASMSPFLYAILGAVLVLFILGGVAYWLLFSGSDSNRPAPTQAAVALNETAPAPTETAPVQGFSDVATDTPTATALPTDTPTPQVDTPQPSGTPTPEPTEAATVAPAVVQPEGISPASLVGTIAYPVFNNRDYDLYFGQADGSGSEFIQPSASQPAFSPDGSRIAFHSWRLDAWGLMTMDLSGANQIIVASFVEDQLPTWTADGKDIILLSRREGDRKSRLIRTGSAQVRGEGVIIGEGEYPSIGPTGQLVFRGWGSTGRGIRLASSSLEGVQIVTDSNEDTAPALSPDGQKVVFMSRRTGNWEVFVVNTDGSSLQQLTEDPADDGLPTWSPDGKVVAFLSNRGGSWAVWATTPDGRDQQQLFLMEGSPDGRVGADENASRGWLEERISWTK